LSPAPSRMDGGRANSKRVPEASPLPAPSEKALAPAPGQAQGGDRLSRDAASSRPEEAAMRDLGASLAEIEARRGPGISDKIRASLDVEERFARVRAWARLVNALAAEKNDGARAGIRAMMRSVSAPPDAVGSALAFAREIESPFYRSRSAHDPALARELTAALRELSRAEQEREEEAADAELDELMKSIEALMATSQELDRQMEAAYLASRARIVGTMAEIDGEMEALRRDRATFEGLAAAEPEASARRVNYGNVIKRLDEAIEALSVERARAERVLRSLDEERAKRRSEMDAVRRGVQDGFRDILPDPGPASPPPGPAGPAPSPGESTPPAGEPKDKPGDDPAEGQPVHVG
jgi:hypothetical protein